MIDRYILKHDTVSSIFAKYSERSMQLVVTSCTVCVCVCLLQGPDQSAEVVRGPHCWCRASGSHTAGAQGEARTKTARPVFQTVNAAAFIDTQIHRCTQRRHPLPLLLIHTFFYHSLSPTCVYYTACNFNEQKRGASSVGNPHHIFLMTHADTLSVEHIAAPKLWLLV